VHQSSKRTFEQLVESIEFLLCPPLSQTQHTTMEIIPLIEAAKRGNEDQMSELLEGGASVSQIDGLGNNALHWAASGGHVAAVQLAIKAGCDVNLQNKGGDTALHKASWRNHPEACQVRASGW
jgi:ankyrin repeat protein